MKLNIKTATMTAAIAAVIAVALLMELRNDVSAHDPDAVPTATPAAVQGCESLTDQDWVLGGIHDFHIDEWDPAVTTPVGYLKIDHSRLLVWFAGPYHGRPGHTDCMPPATPTAVPVSDTPTPEMTSTPTTSIPKLVLIGCRWPDGQEHDFSAPTSPDFHRCVLMGGELEFESYPGGKCEYVYPGFDTDK